MEQQRSDFTETGIRRELGKTSTVGQELIWLEEVGSTNDYAKELALRGGANGTVIVADHQTAGRGRLGRSFQSSKGKGVYLTALLRPDLPAERLILVTALAGVAVCDAVEQVCGVRPGLKWPNDPVLNGKKLCGILTELTIDSESGVPCLILGIGVNVSHRPEDFTPEVQQVATSLTQELGKPVSRTVLTAALIRAIDKLYDALQSGDLSTYLAVFRRDCVNLGKTVQIIGKNSWETAQAVGVDEQFGLVVRTLDGREKTVRSGEVSVRGMYGYAE